MMKDVDYNMDATVLNSFTGGETRTNLIINYLPQNLGDQEFYKIFVVIGPIKNCRIMRDLKTGYSFGFGFVEYQKPDDAAKAILQLNNLAVQHKRIKVSYARPPGDEIKETNLYIQNIPRTYTIEQLEDLFSAFGQIVQKNLLKDKVTGLPRGVGFVRYDKKSEAELAIEQMNGVVPEGGSEPLVVRVAEEHGKMKAAYYAGYHAGLQRRNRRNYDNFENFEQFTMFNNFSQRGGMGYSRGNYNNTQRGGPHHGYVGGAGRGSGANGSHYPISNGGGSNSNGGGSGGGFFGSSGFNNYSGYQQSYSGGGGGYNKY